MDTERKPVAPFYAVAVIWFIYSLFFPLYSMKHYVLMVILSVLVFMLVQSLCSSEAIFRKIPSATQPQYQPPTPVQTPTQSQEQNQTAAQSPSKQNIFSNAVIQTGNPEADQTLRDGQLAISEMKRLNDRILNPEISADIVRLEKISQSIFTEVWQHPEKLPQIRRFMDYYLPTTMKLLHNYDRMGSSGISGENIDSTMIKIEKSMDTIIKAFEKQLDILYSAEAMDISADITVLENLLTQEGLTDQAMPFIQSTPSDQPEQSESSGQPAPSQPDSQASGEDIRLEL